MKLLVQLITITGLLGWTNCQKRNFTNSKVYEINRTTSKLTLDQIKHFQQVLGHDNFDIFKETKEKIDLFVDAKQVDNFEYFLKDNDLGESQIRTKVDNLQEIIDQEQLMVESRKAWNLEDSDKEDFNYDQSRQTVRNHENGTKRTGFYFQNGFGTVPFNGIFSENFLS